MKLTKPFVKKVLGHCKGVVPACHLLKLKLRIGHLHQVQLTLLDQCPLSDCPSFRDSDKTGTRNKAPFTPEHVVGHKVIRHSSN